MLKSTPKDFLAVAQIQGLLLKEVPKASKLIKQSSVQSHPPPPLYNFVSAVLDLMTAFTKSALCSTFNIFILDHHFRQGIQPAQIYRKVKVLMNGFRKHSETQEGRLLLSFLSQQRNSPTAIRNFLRIRKVLLRNLSQKLLSKLSLSHQDAMTITHTLSWVAPEDRIRLARSINNSFVAQKAKKENIFDGVAICEFFMQELGSSNVSYSSKPPKERSLLPQFSFISNNLPHSSISPDSSNQYMDSSNQYVDSLSEEIELETESGFVDFTRCMQELTVLKEKDKEMDNRFKKCSWVKT